MLRHCKGNGTEPASTPGSDNWTPTAPTSKRRRRRREEEGGEKGTGQAYGPAWTKVQ
jgi:hypothetical protein